MASRSRSGQSDGRISQSQKQAQQSILDYNNRNKTDTTNIVFGKSAEDLTKQLKEFTNELKKSTATGKQQQELTKEYIAQLKKTNSLSDYQNKLFDKQIKELEKESKRSGEQGAGQQFAQGLLDKLEKTLKSISDTADSFVDKIETQAEQIANSSIKVNANLDGTNTTYQNINRALTDTFGSSGSVKVSDIMQNVAILTSQGITNNVEQRAYLMTIKDGIAETFSATDSTLLRLIKLQGEDSTAHRLTLQASLKEYLNDMYNNSEALSKTISATTNALVEAMSLQSSSSALDLESTMQKWTSSLYEEGMSESTVSLMAQTIGNIASGNIRDINSSMQSLMILSANRSGLDYGDLLTGGLSSDQTNLLMYNAVKYLSDIYSSNQNNNVVLSEYANLFGIKVSDLVGAYNSSDVLGDILGTTISTSDETLATYMNKYSSYLNMAPATIMGNWLSNVQYGLASNLANNPSQYIASRVMGMLYDVLPEGGDISALIKAGVSAVRLGNTIIDSSAVTSLGSFWKQLSGFGNDLLGVAQTITGVNTLGEYNTLMNTNYTGRSISGNLNTGSSAFNTTKSTSITVSDLSNTIDTLESQRTANDIWEFLANDAVMVTASPVDSSSGALSYIVEYNKRTAIATELIATYFVDNGPMEMLIGTILSQYSSAYSGYAKTQGVESSYNMNGL